MAIEPGPQFYKHIGSYDGVYPVHQQMAVSAEGAPGEAIIGRMERRLDQHFGEPEDRDYSGGKNFGQGTLFSSHPAMPWTVSDLYSHPRMSVGYLPHVLGAMTAHSLRTSGKLPAASDDLSVHSERLVNRLAEKGFTKPVDEAKVYRNSINKERGAEDALYGARLMEKNGEKMSPKETSEARAIGRDALRSKRSKKPEQGELF